MTTAFTVVIPSRYASTRLPGKPLQLIGNKPMIQLVWEQACKSSAERVVVATDDVRIIEVCKGFGAETVMTREDHNSCTDRLAEVAAKLGLAPDAIVVNVQGDEPLIPPSVIDQVAANLAAHGEARMATLAEPIEDIETLFNPNVVKVVSDINGLALTFSRATLPWARDDFAKTRDVLPAGVPYRRHIGIYAYRAGFLHDFVSWGPCWLENTESLEQLRALWHGVRIHVGDALEAPPAGVDTLEDLGRVRRVLGFWCRFCSSAWAISAVRLRQKACCAINCVKRAWLIKSKWPRPVPVNGTLATHRTSAASVQHCNAAMTCRPSVRNRYRAPISRAMT